jgi:hypothetical protein
MEWAEADVSDVIFTICIQGASHPLGNKDGACQDFDETAGSGGSPTALEPEDEPVIAMTHWEFSCRMCQGNPCIRQLEISSLQ